MTDPREPFMALIKAMGEELRLTSGLKGLDPQFHRRLLVRVLFSTFEAFAFHLKQRTLEAGNAGGIQFSQTEQRKLTETKIVERPDGSTEERSFFLKSQDNLAFAVAIYSRVMGVEPPPAFPAEAMSTGIAVRHRLTHPKSAAAFMIQDSEAQAIVRLAEWFKVAYQWSSSAELASIERIRKEMSTSIQNQIATIRAAQDDHKA